MVLNIIESFIRISIDHLLSEFGSTIDMMSFELDAKATPLALSLLVLALAAVYSLKRSWSRSVTQVQSNALVLRSPIVEPQVSKEVDAPEGWFTDAKTFELERRAIFSQASNMLSLPGISRLIVADMALHNSCVAFLKGRGLSELQDSGFPILLDHGER